MTAVAQVRELSSEIGRRRVRVDADAKIRGESRYAGDRDVPGLLHGRLVLSPYAHAQILRIDSAQALAVPGVVAVLSAADLPVRHRGGARRYEPLAREEVVFAGQPVAVVVATSEAAAADGAELVFVEYDELPAVVTMAEAVVPNAPPARIRVDLEAAASDASLHADVGASGGGNAPANDFPESPNIVGRTRYHSGDVELALAACDAVVDAEFETSWVQQSPLETQVATAWLEGDQLVVSASTQALFFAQQELALLYGLPPHRVRVHAETLGGGFGAKFILVEPIVAGATLALRRPVRLAFTRTEEFLAGQPAQGLAVSLRVGASQDGQFVAIAARTLLDTGAYTEWSVHALAPIFLAGPYRWPSFDLRSYGVRTNKAGAGAYRGPGAPPLAFALESALDELAGKLRLDPIELRRRNIVSAGEPMIDGTPWPALGAAEVLDAISQHPLWQHRTPGDGTGVALGVWPGTKEGASAVCRLDSDGGITIVTGAVDMTGTATGFAAIAAEAFGVSAEDVRVMVADSLTAPRTPASGGSVVTYAIGRAVEDAARNARARLLQIAGERLERTPAELDICGGIIKPREGGTSTELRVSELAIQLAAGTIPFPPLEATGAARPAELSPSCACHLVQIEVDLDTGESAVLAHVVAQDVGRAINPALVEGQIRGGATQAIGWALMEELIHDETGALSTPNFSAYGIPSPQAVPRIEPLIVEVPSPHGPFGAKGIGEASVVAGPAAVANAIADATGCRLRRLPMTPWRIWRAFAASTTARRAD